jgi:hypothetical protein
MKSNNENLPIRRNLKLVYILSLIIASLFVFASALGILLKQRRCNRVSLNA